MTDGRTEAADVYVVAGKIAALMAPGSTLDARTSVDADGQHVLPGIVDAHTHFRTWSGHSDTLEQMLESAAYGGVTTAIGFVMGMNAPGTDLLHRVQEFGGGSNRTVPIDYALHAAIADEPQTISQLGDVTELGVNTFKMFMINRARKMMVDDAFLFRAMTQISALGGLAMVHAELEDVTCALIEQNAGRTDVDEVRRFSLNRPEWAEAEATRRALLIAERAECPVYVVHVTSERALDEIKLARARGQEVYAETCPQYLTLTEDDARRLGGLAKVAPPLRSARDARVLMDAVLSGEINVVSSDHAPYTRATKTDPATPYADIPVGMPGTETLLPLMWSLLASRGASVVDLIRVTTSNPASIFGLPGKGTLSVGADADITIVDLEHPSTINGDNQHTTAGYSAYHGRSVPLTVKSTFVRGVPVLADGVLVNDDRGRFLRRTVHTEGRQPTC
ncbi:dihydroorotase family protein [Nonomuraea sp. NPDC059007]|uniref:dihydroorotase n=1 Tax=Nonomuraea sp. NPDC059007 TaxID=3346692 RepID=UPI0036B777C1